MLTFSLTSVKIFDGDSQWFVNLEGPIGTAVPIDFRTVIDPPV